MKKMKIGILIGSLRRESFNRKIAQTLIQVAPKSLDIAVIEINDLPMFNQDLEATPPKEWLTFRKKLEDLDGYLLVTPEYNRSVPAVLKNAIDVGSRPYGQAYGIKNLVLLSAHQSDP